MVTSPTKRAALWLSSENNTPEHARAAVERILSACGALADGVTLAVAPRSEPGPTYAL